MSHEALSKPAKRLQDIISQVDLWRKVGIAMIDTNAFVMEMLSAIQSISIYKLFCDIAL